MQVAGALARPRFLHAVTVARTLDPHGPQGREERVALPVVRIVQRLMDLRQGHAQSADAADDVAGALVRGGIQILAELFSYETKFRGLAPAFWSHDVELQLVPGCGEWYCADSTSTDEPVFVGHGPVPPSLSCTISGFPYAEHQPFYRRKMDQLTRGIMTALSV